MNSLQLERLLRQTDGLLEEWDFFAKPYTDKDCLAKFGTVSVDDEDIQITNSAMASVVELLAAVRAGVKEAAKDRTEANFEIRELHRKLEQAEEHAAMSDWRIADQLDKEIKWFEANDGEESLIYGPTLLMGYCRDRLRNRK